MIPPKLKPTRERWQGTAVGVVLALTVVGSAFVAKQLVSSNAASTAASGTRAAIQAARLPVPFLGPFAQHHKGMQRCGPAVRIMEGALRHTHPPVRTTPAAPCMGAASTRQLKRFQARHHIPPTGIYGERTHKALAHAYTAAERGDLLYLAKRRVDQLHRQTIGIVTQHAFANRGSMGYCNNGSLANCSLRGVWPAWPGVPRWADCSSYVSWVYYQAGLPSPNATSYPGNTRSLVLHGVPVTRSVGALRVGDLVFYGYNNSHVAIYVGNGLVSSHGQPGIKVVPWNYRTVYAVRRYIL